VRADDEPAAGPQRSMQPQGDLPLDVVGEVREGQISTEDEVETSLRRVAAHVVEQERHPVAVLWPQASVVERALAQLRGELAQAALRVARQASAVEHVTIDVGRQHVDRDRFGRVYQRVRLLSGRATGAPGPDGRPERGQYHVTQGLEDCAVAPEARDRHVAEALQDRPLVGVPSRSRTRSPTRTMQW
jgi:hypothetical protein